MISIKKSWLNLLIIFLLFSGSVFSAEHLEPEDSLYTGISSIEYNQMVLNYLREANDRDVLARVFVYPSFEPEYAIGIKKKEESYTIFKISPTLELWGYETISMLKEDLNIAVEDKDIIMAKEAIKEYEETYPKNYLDVPIKRCDVKIQESLANDIVSLWEQMLLETRYEKSQLFILDGVSYHFSMNIGTQILAGQTASPDKETKPGKLVALTDAMASFCKKKTKTKLRALKRSKVSLRKALESNQQEPAI